MLAQYILLSAAFPTNRKFSNCLDLLHKREEERHILVAEYDVLINKKFSNCVNHSRRREEEGLILVGTVLRAEQSVHADGQFAIH